MEMMPRSGWFIGPGGRSKPYADAEDWTDAHEFGRMALQVLELIGESGQGEVYKVRGRTKVCAVVSPPGSRAQKQWAAEQRRALTSFWFNNRRQTLVYLAIGRGGRPSSAHLWLFDGAFPV